MRRLAIGVVLAATAGCGGGVAVKPVARPATTGGTVASSSTSAATAPTTSATSKSATTTAATSRSTTTTAGTVVDVGYRVERRTADAATADFEAVVDRTLADPRGWRRARFRLVRRAAAPFAIVLAEPDDAEALCLPHDVHRTYSCQNGPVVVLNAERWRHATPEWTGDVATYRVMVVNHEVGHLLGLHHPQVQCPHRGAPAPVMAQQSTELNGCLPNPWPLEAEVERASRHDLPLAPP